MDIHVIGRHVNYPFFLLDLNHTWNFTMDFQNMLNIIFHENPSSGSRVVPWWWTGVTKLIVDFHHFSTAPNQDIPERKQLFRDHRCASADLGDRGRWFLRTLLPIHKIAQDDARPWHRTIRCGFAAQVDLNPNNKIYSYCSSKLSAI
jgi:hypothetical protein